MSLIVLAGINFLVYFTKVEPKSSSSSAPTIRRRRSPKPSACCRSSSGSACSRTADCCRIWEQAEADAAPRPLPARRRICEAQHAGSGGLARTLAVPCGTPTDEPDCRRRRSCSCCSRAAQPQARPRPCRSREPVAVEPAPPPPPPVEPRCPADADTRARRRRAPRSRVVLDADTPAHAAVADEIAAALSPRLYRVARFTTADAAALEALRDRARDDRGRRREAVRSRARSAARASRSCSVRCRDPDEALQAGGPIWGVQSLPPLALQLKSWQAVDPSLAHDRADRQRLRRGAGRRSAACRDRARNRFARRDVGVRSRDAVSVPPARHGRRRALAAARQRCVEPASAARAAELRIVARHRRADVQRSAA